MRARAAPGRGGLTPPAAAAAQGGLGMDVPTPSESLARADCPDKQVAQ
jgi:hypothetical protein